MSLSAASVRSNPKIQFLQQRYQHAIDLAAEKVALHLKSPSQYPMPSAGKKSLERALADLVKSIPKRRQEKFLDRLRAATTATAAQRQQKYRDLAAVNLKSNKPIAEQVQDLAVDDQHKITEAEIIKFRPKAEPAQKGFTGKLLPKARQPRQAVTATRLDFVVDSLTCVKTNDIRKDEISLSAFATDAVGVNSDRAPFFIGEFKKGDNISLGGNSTLFSFSIDDGSVGSTFPLTFVAGLVAIEADLIHNADLGNKLAVLFSILGVTLLVISMGVLFIPGIGPTLALITLLVSLGFDLLGHYVFPVIIDDFSIPVVDTLVLDAPPAPGDVFTRTLQLEIERSALAGLTKGTYTANVRWVVS